VYWDGPNGSYLYVMPEWDVIKAYRLVGQRFGIEPTSEGGAITPGMPGGFLSISANGNAPGTGIVWASHPLLASAETETVDGILQAYDASNLTIELWNSETNASRDATGKVAKFTPPTVVNGKVYLATFSRRLVVYGLR
jgi:hypothetical protein